MHTDRAGIQLSSAPVKRPLPLGCPSACGQHPSMPRSLLPTCQLHRVCAPATMDTWTALAHHSSTNWMAARRHTQRGTAVRGAVWCGVPRARRLARAILERAQQAANTADNHAPTSRAWKWLHVHVPTAPSARVCVTDALRSSCHPSIPHTASCHPSIPHTASWHLTRPCCAHPPYPPGQAAGGPGA